MKLRDLITIFAVVLAFVVLFVVIWYCIHFYTPIENVDEMRSYFTPLDELPAPKRNHGGIRPEDVVIYMVATPEIAEYAQFSIEANEAYANDYGFQFEIINRNLLPKGYPINFTKIAAYFQVLLPKYPKAKYFVHIDADAVIHNKHYDLRDIIAHYMHPIIHFLISEDCYDRKICSKPNRINSGVFIVRNSSLGQAIMQRWLQSIEPGQCGADLIHQFPNCQLIFERCVRSLFFPNIRIVPYNVLNGVDGLFIHHYMQGQMRERIDEIKTTLGRTVPSFAQGHARMRVF